MNRFDSKLPDLPVTIFTKMSQLAIKHNAVNLSQGFPDYGVDEALTDLIHSHLKAGHNQYTHGDGLLSLREEIANKIYRSYDLQLDPQKNITVTSGATEALFNTIACLIQPGDEVIIFAPAYDSYAPVIKLFGGKVIELPLSLPDFKIDWDLVDEHLNDKTKLIVINSPHNPSGSVIDKSDLEKLESIVSETGCFVLSDEVYEHLVYDGLSHESILKSDVLRENGVAVFSFGKTFHATGWKIGYAIAGDTMMNEFRKVHQFNTFTTNTPIQYALADYLKANVSLTNELPSFFQSKRDLFLEAMSSSRFVPMKCSGTYFQLMNYKDISDEHDEDFADRITIEYGVASIPVSVFYENGVDNKVVRFCFAKKDETLLRAAEKLCQI